MKKNYISSTFRKFVGLFQKKSFVKKNESYYVLF